MKTVHSFQKDDVVIDITAESNGWTDVRGKVLEVDGPHVLVEYDSGNRRAKLAAHLRRE